MSELKLGTKLAHFARYMGFRNSVPHQSSIGNAYILRRENWVEIHEDDIQFFKSKSKVSDDWEYKLDKVKLLDTYYYAMWISNTAKQRVKFSLSDKDNYGNSIPNTLRDYVFPNRTWIKIDERDVRVFNTKAQGNKYWKFEKAYLQQGIQAPQNTGALSVQEGFTLMMKALDKGIEDKIINEESLEVLNKLIIDEDEEILKVDPHLTDAEVEELHKEEDELEEGDKVIAWQEGMDEDHKPTEEGVEGVDYEVEEVSERQIKEEPPIIDDEVADETIFVDPHLTTKEDAISQADELLTELTDKDKLAPSGSEEEPIEVMSTQQSIKAYIDTEKEAKPKKTTKKKKVVKKKTKENDT